MNMDNLKYIFFDFGGTLDLDGKHWYKHWLQSYADAGIEVNEEDFKKAYFLAEEELNAMPEINIRYSKLVNLKCSLQLRRLYPDASNDEIFELAWKLSSVTFVPIMLQAEKTREVLEQVKTQHKIGVISNFYGNLARSLQEMDILDLVDVCIDSKREGIRKPNEQIYRVALKRAGIAPEEAAMVGDSYRQDMVPAKAVGMTTIMLDVPQLGEPEGTEHTAADYKIKSINNLIEIINH